MRKEEKDILEFLPIKLSEHIRSEIPKNEKITEIRIRVYKPLIVKTVTKEYVFHEIMISVNEVNNIFNIITEFSAYAFENSIKNGFITVKGGHRIGICGDVIYENGAIKYINNISYINMRAAWEVKNCGKNIFELLFAEKLFENTLIISRPGKGKTTLLRDLIRLLSNQGRNITVIDERNEISGSFKGCSQNDLGIRTDIMSSCKKKDGIVMAVRAMAPQIIAVDEIGGSEDIEALNFASHCGVGIIATVHGNGLDSVDVKLAKLFENYILIEEIGEYKCL